MIFQTRLRRKASPTETSCLRLDRTEQSIIYSIYKGKMYKLRHDCSAELLLQTTCIRKTGGIAKCSTYSEQTALHCCTYNSSCWEALFTAYTHTRLLYRASTLNQTVHSQTRLLFSSVRTKYQARRLRVGCGI